MLSDTNSGLSPPLAGSSVALGGPWGGFFGRLDLGEVDLGLLRQFGEFGRLGSRKMLDQCRSAIRRCNSLLASASPEWQ